MGFKLIAQLTLITAGLVLIFVYIQPSLASMKSKQDELQEYNDAIAKASEFNARLHELINTRDSFSSTDLRALEKFVPSQIDQLKVMSEIAGILSSQNISITKMVAHEIVDPLQGIELESGIIPEGGIYSDLSYQDYEVSFEGSYENLRTVLQYTEASDSLIEVVELNFDTSKVTEKDGLGDPVIDSKKGKHTFNITFRTYGFPVAINE